MKPQKCRATKCPVMVIMAKHKTNRTFAPIELQPSEDGNILLTGEEYEVLNVEDRATAKLRGFVLRKNHFATCEYSRSFAKRVASRKARAVGK